MRAIILAGGKGTRLRPYTVAIPKPLVPVDGDKPILGVLIEQLKKSGFTHITLAVSHMADIIMAYCGDGSRWGVKIDYSREEKPLHTIGALTVIPDLPENFLVINGDTLTDLNYGKFLKEHIRRGNRVSVAAQNRNMPIEFGVVSFDKKGHLKKFQEKPAHYSHVTMGINCLHRSVIEALPKGEFYGFDALMYDSLKKKQKVWIHQHQGFWLDIGRPADYQWAVENITEIKKLIRASTPGAKSQGKAKSKSAGHHGHVHARKSRASKSRS